MEFDVVERADSSLEDDLGTDGSSEAVHCFAKHVDQIVEEKKRTTTTKGREIDGNGDKLLAEKKNTEEKQRKWPAEPSMK